MWRDGQDEAEEQGDQSEPHGREVPGTRPAEEPSGS